MARVVSKSNHLFNVFLLHNVGLTQHTLVWCDIQSQLGDSECAMHLHADEADDPVSRTMVVERRPVQRYVVRTFAAALITSYVLVAVQAVISSSNCGVDEYYDDLAEDCRSCDLLCDPVYQTPHLCDEKCPGIVT